MNNPGDAGSSAYQPIPAQPVNPLQQLIQQLLSGQPQNSGSGGGPDLPFMGQGQQQQGQLSGLLEQMFSGAMQPHPALGQGQPGGGNNPGQSFASGRFSWGGREWGAGDRAAFIAHLASQGVNPMHWATFHPQAAAIIGINPGAGLGQGAPRTGV